MKAHTDINSKHASPSRETRTKSQARAAGGAPQFDPLKPAHRFLSATPLSTREATTITVEEAKYYLSKWNSANRRKRVVKSSLDQYAKDMEAGTFDVAEAISFDTRGNLMNGQTRLNAVVKSGRPLDTFVHYGVNPGAALNMDNHAKRTKSAALNLQDAPNGNVISSVAFNLAVVAANWNPSAATNSASAAVYAAHGPALDWLAAKVSGKANRAFRKMGFLTAVARYLTDPGTAGEAEAFLGRVMLGAGLAASSPELLLRNHLTSSLGNRRTGGGAGLRIDYENTQQAFEACLEGRELKHFTRGGRASAKPGAAKAAKAPPMPDMSGYDPGFVSEG